MKVLKFIDEQFEKWFLIVSLIVMVLVTFMQIVLRWFNAATVWAEEFSRYVMLYQVWVGASYAVHEDAHIRITALIGKLSGGRHRGMMDLVVLTLWLLFALWLTVEGCVLVAGVLRDAHPHDDPICVRPHRRRAHDDPSRAEDCGASEKYAGRGGLRC